MAIQSWDPAETIDSGNNTNILQLFFWGGGCSLHASQCISYSPPRIVVRLNLGRNLGSLLLLSHYHLFLLTAACVDLKLPVDVGFVYQGVQHIENAVDIPDFGV